MEKIKLTFAFLLYNVSILCGYIKRSLRGCIARGRFVRWKSIYTSSLNIVTTFLKSHAYIGLYQLSSWQFLYGYWGVLFHNGYGIKLSNNGEI